MARRLFIALSIDELTQKRLARWRERNIPASTGKYIAKENFHLTLAFLGECNESSLVKVQKLMDELLHRKNYSSFSLCFEHLGYFKKSSSVWLGLEEKNPLVQEIAHSIQEQLSQQLSFQFSPSFTPHITILRKAKSLPETIEEQAEFTIYFTHIHLYESCQSEGKVEYRSLTSWLLKPSQN